ncbi:MAG: S8 family serine peptidase [Byssovorax sp.]
MKTFKFTALGNEHRFSLSTSGTAGPSKPKNAAASPRAGNDDDDGLDTTALLKELLSHKTIGKNFTGTDPTQFAVLAPPTIPGPRRAGAGQSSGDVLTILTPTMIVEGFHQADLDAAIQAGASVVTEGIDGKVLLRVARLDDLAALGTLLTRRAVAAFAPNFLRVRPRTRLSTRGVADWAHDKINVAEAWKITKGKPEVRVAVLDEGVDTAHKALKDSIVGEKDFIGNKKTAMPDGDDAHGTACSGIIVSRSATALGIAPRCSLLAARIAMDDGSGDWTIEDFSTADAIDWARHERADVLSISWGGGAPSDIVSRAFGRAKTQGRNGKGSVVCIAAGNDQRPIDFPGELPGYLTVGASNPDDQRKTKTSSDGEKNWGSNYGPTLSLLAPGVFIHTTDITGTSGYDAGDFTTTFNGTSAATPHVAAAAALMISSNPDLSADEVAQILTATADPLEIRPGERQTERTDKLGYGRLNVGKAVAAAKARR